MDLLLIANSAAFLVAAVCWSKRGVTNALIKIAMFGLCLMNVLATLKVMGYLVRMGG